MVRLLKHAPITLIDALSAGYSHLLQLRKRFEKEKSMLAINHLRVFLSDTIDAIKKDEEIQSKADIKFWGALSPILCSTQSNTASDSSGCIIA